MSFQLDTEVLCHLLPEDGDAAEHMFVERLQNPAETYIVAFGFTYEPMVAALLAAHARGVPLHLYLDHSQSVGTTEAPQVKRLVDAGIEVTIGTSTAGSKYICHTKGVVVLEDWDPIGPWCWHGSVNFSLSGWKQTNTAMVFRSKAWADHFLEQFRGMRQFAWTKQRRYQLMSQPPEGVTP